MSAPSRPLRSKRRITIREVARAAGVSLGTASRVINGSASVAPELRRNVERTIAELGYLPNVNAQNIRSGASRSVGIVVSDITIPTLAALVRAAQEEMQGAGYGVLIGCHDWRPEREREILDFLGRRRVEGIVASTCANPGPELAAGYAALGVPIVLYDRDLPKSADAVRVAHREAVRRAAQHLLGLGHRRIGLVTGAPPVYTARTRLEGYLEAHRQAEVPVDPGLIRTMSFDASVGLIETTALLGLAEPPTALILGGGDFLPGGLRAIRNAGLRIPQDLSLIATTDSDLAMLATPPITVIRWSYPDVGRTCARLLCQRLAQPDQAGPRHVILDTELVTRESCAPPRDRGDAIGRSP